MDIEVIRGTTVGDFRPLAEFYLNQILNMTENGKYKDPAIEAEFQEWMKERKSNNS